MMPLLFPLGNYYLMGARYFGGWRPFVAGTLLVAVLYWFSVVVLTVAVRWAVRRFPHLWQAVPRTITMLALVGGLTAGLAVLDVWVYSLVPATGVRFTRAAVEPILVLGALFAVFLCLALSIFYSYGQWDRHQADNDELKRANLQHQFDTLKRQLNPHFLFNSLNSLSLLIGEDPAQAEQFVDDLARVYRYLLQAGPNARPRTAADAAHELVPLQGELAFIRTYASLLRARYGDGLRINVWVPPGFATHYLPHLSLQAVIDHVIQHNVMLPKTPLVITITAHSEGLLRIQHNRQQKTIRLETNQNGFAQLETKYHLLGQQRLRVEQTEQHTAVLLPLLNSCEL
ncbi:histidine kinase [Hymenobacter sp. BT439]|uniref:Histidine kinase n=2 Tax=Hymenobacter properus TaxID=2791026 RepID=A0A931BIE5_9BACT|nr:histidine kinase [Hymenobacter properus]